MELDNDGSAEQERLRLKTNCYNCYRSSSANIYVNTVPINQNSLTGGRFTCKVTVTSSLIRFWNNDEEKVHVGKCVSRGSFFHEGRAISGANKATEDSGAQSISKHEVVSKISQICVTRYTCNYLLIITGLCSAIEIC